MMDDKNIFAPTWKALSLAGFIFVSLSGTPWACSTQAWDDSNTGSVVAADSGSAYEGNCGLKLMLDGNSTGWIRDTTPATVNPAVGEYVARFYIHVDEAQLSNGQAFTLFNAVDAANNELFGLDIKGTANGPVLHTYATDTTTHEATGDVAIPPGWRAVILHWKTGAADGSLRLGLDDNTDVQSITGLANAGQSIDAVNLGIVSGNTAGITGSADIDAFMSRRSGTSGLLIGKACSGTKVSVSNTTFLPGSITCDIATSLTMGNRVTLDPGATVVVQSPSVILASGTLVRKGAVLDVQIQ